LEEVEKQTRLLRILNAGISDILDTSREEEEEEEEEKEEEKILFSTIHVKQVLHIRQIQCGRLSEKL